MDGEESVSIWLFDKSKIKSFGNFDRWNRCVRSNILLFRIVKFVNIGAKLVAKLSFCANNFETSNFVKFEQLTEKYPKILNV